MIARPVVLLPHPDSPTSPRVSPRRTSRLMPDTALTTRAGATDGELDHEILDPQQDVVGVGAEVGLAGARHQPASSLVTLVRSSASAASTPGAAAGALTPSSTRFSWYSGDPTGYQHRYVWPGASAGDQRRILGVAPVAHVRAAGCEAAAERRVDEVGRPARDRGQPGVRRVLELGDARQQRLGVRHLHVGEQGRGRGVLDDPAAVHDGDLVGVAGDDTEVVGDEDHRHVALAALLADQVEDLRLHGDVERGGRLVGEQQGGAAGQGDRDHDPLAHAARQLVRVLLEPLRGLGDPDVGEQPLGRRHGVARSTARGGRGAAR